METLINIRRSALSDYLLAVMMISLMYLYFHHQSDKSPPGPPAENAGKIDYHKARLQKRSERVKEVCGDFNNSLRLEHNALYYSGWSTLIGRGLSRLCSDWLVTPALLCHKEPPQGTQGTKFALSLWHKNGFHARKVSIMP